jgi:hypothetical protein
MGEENVRRAPTEDGSQGVSRRATQVGGGGGGYASLYTGITSQAVLTENNAETITLEAYQAGDISTSTVDLMALSESGETPAVAPTPLAIVRLLGKAVDTILLQPVPSARASSAQAAKPMADVTVSDTIYDGMGGSMSYTLSVDDQTGKFSGTFNFNSWHGDGGETISGETAVSGDIDLGTGEFTQVTFSFNPVTFGDGYGSFSIYGDVSLTVGASSGTALLDLVLRDEFSGETVRIDDYTVMVTDGPDDDLDGEPDYEDADLSGRIYLSNHGYVDVATTTRFRSYAGYDIPSRGQMVVRGADGNSARLTVIEGIPVSSGYYVEADLDGLPGYEWSSIDHPWT